MILYGEQNRSLEVKIPGYYLGDEHQALCCQTITGIMMVEVIGMRIYEPPDFLYRNL